jgi:hypothetical protein
MKNIDYRKLANMSFSKVKLLEKDFDWFKELVRFYVDAGKLDKPTEKEIRDRWKEITGLEINKNKEK